MTKKACTVAAQARGRRLLARKNLVFLIVVVSLCKQPMAESIGIENENMLPQDRLFEQSDNLQVDFGMLASVLLREHLPRGLS
ncbi:MAG: hypothetical protein RLZZ396_3227 [Planctomycetota bacterium]